MDYLFIYLFILRIRWINYICMCNPKKVRGTGGQKCHLTLSIELYIFWVYTAYKVHAYWILRWHFIWGLHNLQDSSLISLCLLYLIIVMIFFRIMLLWLVGSWVLAVIVAWFVHWIYKWYNRTCKGVLPSGSMGLPLIGETFQLVEAGYSLDMIPFMKKRIQR